MHMALTRPESRAVDCETAVFYSLFLLSALLHSACPFNVMILSVDIMVLLMYAAQQSLAIARFMSPTVISLHLFAQSDVTGFSCMLSKIPSACYHADAPCQIENMTA